MPANTFLVRGWSRADLRSVYWFWGHLIWVPKFKNGKKRKAKILHKNKKLQSLTFFSKLKTHFQNWFNTVRRTSDSGKVFLEYLKVQILKILLLAANHGGTSSWPSTWHGFTNAQITALDQPLMVISDVQSPLKCHCRVPFIKKVKSQKQPLRSFL